MQYDGLLVLYYTPTGYRLWQQGSEKATKAKFVDEGGLWKFVLRSRINKNIWEAPKSTGSGNPMLILQDDGNLVFGAYRNPFVWESGTFNKAYCPGTSSMTSETIELFGKDTSVKIINCRMALNKSFVDRTIHQNYGHSPETMIV